MLAEGSCTVAEDAVGHIADIGSIADSDSSVAESVLLPWAGVGT